MKKKFMPVAIRKAIEAQHPGLFKGHSPTKREGGSRRRRGLYVGPKLEVMAEPLTLWFPGLKLRSLNTMLGAGAKEAQTNAKREARAAARDYTGELWKIPGRVCLEFFQYAPVLKMDVDNLCAKHLQDALTASHEGLGIIPDDSAKFVSWVKCGGVEREVVGVLVNVILESENDQ